MSQAWDCVAIDFDYFQIKQDKKVIKYLSIMIVSIPRIVCLTFAPYPIRKNY